jgi:hypothetical protein
MKVRERHPRVKVHMRDAQVLHLEGLNGGGRRVAADARTKILYATIRAGRGRVGCLVRQILNGEKHAYRSVLPRRGNGVYAHVRRIW